MRNSSDIWSRGDKPIITSLADIDFYKFTMGQLVFHRYPEVNVGYGLINRTVSVPLAEFIDPVQLKAELDHARTLNFTNTELHYLRGTNEYGERMFKEDYLQFLQGLKLPDYQLDFNGGRIDLQFFGPWSISIYWETIALAIVNELYYRRLTKDLSNFSKDAMYAQAQVKLQEKIKILKQHPGITFCDFGTRRRFSQSWQLYVDQTLAEELPKTQFLGTSNTLIAMLLGLLPMGTAAHELFMVLAALSSSTDEGIRSASNRVLRDWWDEYGLGLAVALPDTFGSDFFFKDFSKEQANNWKGLRQDSGDPFVFGDKAIAFYKNFGIDPREKLTVFSDGLEITTILSLYQKFSERTKVTFGWGTNLTNDLGWPNLSLVVKAMSANGLPTVKLSDNLKKALGPISEVERYKRIFGYTNTFSEDCRR